MVLGLVPNEDEERIFNRLLDFYSKLYVHEGVTFKKEEKILAKKDIGEVYYTYPGEEEIAHSQEKMRMVEEALKEGYGTPIIALRKGKKLVLIDGHRRLRVAWEKGVNWRARIIVPSREMKFGIEKTVLGQMKKLFR